MLTISFQCDDIARTRIAAGPDPLWELVLAIHMLRGQRGDLLFAGWRRDTTTRLRNSRGVAELSLLSALTPTVGYFPDFLNPYAALQGVEHGLETVRATPVTALARDLRRMSVPLGAKDAVRALADGDVGTLTALTQAMDVFYQAAVAPHRSTVDAAARHDRTVRVSTMADRGVEAVLATLHPTVVWDGSRLLVRQHPGQHIDLAGRGLTLIPSYFCVNHPVTLLDQSLQPVLVYPIKRTAATSVGTRALAALIGHTRAEILAAIGAGGNTTDVARRAGVANASASEHLTVLRDAGLVASHRDRNRTVHQITDLGVALLSGG